MPQGAAGGAGGDGGGNGGGRDGDGDGAGGNDGGDGGDAGKGGEAAAHDAVRDVACIVRMLYRPDDQGDAIGTGPQYWNQLCDGGTASVLEIASAAAEHASVSAFTFDTAISEGARSNTPQIS